jgi:hypothetical protein
MKKTLALGLGLALIGGSVISFTNASRDAYHVYMYQQGRATHAPSDPQFKQRPFSRRMGAYTNTRTFRRDTERYGVNPSQNTRYPQNDIRNRGAISRSRLETENYRLLRPSTGRIIGQTQLNSHRKAPINLKAEKDTVVKFVTYENEKFSMELPFGWRASGEDSHTFVHPRSDYNVSVKYLEEACEGSGFMACAITLSKDLNHKNPAEKIAITGSIKRQSHFYGTVLHESLQTRTYTESFPAEIAGKNIYISRQIVADLSGGVYIVETQTALENASKFLEISRNIFDSFQVFPLEK